jgi:hypothetical protein
MSSSIRKLRNREVQKDLRDWYEFHLIAGLNGATRSNRPPGIAAHAPLPKTLHSSEVVRLFLLSLKGVVEPEYPLGPSAQSIGLLPTGQRDWLRWVNRDLKRYQQYPQIVFDREAGELRTQMVFSDGAKGDWENNAIRCILDLFKDRQLFRLRGCPCCRQWFYAMRDDQRFCSTACRQKEHSQSPDFKERRARYMRDEYRPGEKRRASRAKRQAAQVRPEGRK